MYHRCISFPKSKFVWFLQSFGILSILEVIIDLSICESSLVFSFGTFRDDSSDNLHTLLNRSTTVDINWFSGSQRSQTHIHFESTGQRTVLTLSFECYSFKFLDKTLQGLQDSSSGTAPLASTLTSSWRHARDSFSQASPLCFCIQYVIKNWRRERPGNEARLSPHAQVQFRIPEQRSLGTRLDERLSALGLIPRPHFSRPPLSEK